TMGTLYDIEDTAKLDTYAAPRRGFYGKAAIRRTVQEGNLMRTLYSYGQEVASATIEEEETPNLQGGTTAVTFLVFTLHTPELYATATTRRHIRAFARMVEDIARHLYTGGTERPTVNVQYFADCQWQTLVDGDDTRGTFREGQLCNLVEHALHDIPQARAY
ncbi:MAG: hypothetical protein LUD72_14690, partial [Bacteroidales bacterium]|nr:hypothetical protein [Bacteroidales bacterium]